MKDLTNSFFLICGGSFIFIAALGVLRMPDVYTRIHSSTKAGTLGVGFILLSVAMHFSTVGIVTRCIAAIFFIIITAPVSAQLIGMAAYKSGLFLWKESHINQQQNSSNE